MAILKKRTVITLGGLYLMACPLLVFLLFWKWNEALYGVEWIIIEQVPMPVLVVGSILGLLGLAAWFTLFEIGKDVEMPE